MEEGKTKPKTIEDVIACKDYHIGPQTQAIIINRS